MTAQKPHEKISVRELRAWLREHHYEVADRGAISAKHREAYDAAHGEG